MPKPGRLLYLLVLVTGFVVAGIQLRAQGVAFFDVALTGLGFIGGLVLFFLALIGIGKLLGRLTSDRG